jgi:hypothetical protein
MSWGGAASLPQTPLGVTKRGGSRIHLTIGNTTGFTWSAAAYSATVDSGGNIASWGAAPSLGVARYFGALAGDGHGGLIMVGGIMPSMSANSLEHTATDSAGNLLGWTHLGELPVPTGSVAAVGARNAVYVFGGLVGEGVARRPTADVWRAPLL